MTVMKQANAGKDTEAFLGDESAEKKPLLQAKAEPPPPSRAPSSRLPKATPR
jgi:hypothetical protein